MQGPRVRLPGPAQRLSLDRGSAQEGRELSLTSTSVPLSRPFPPPGKLFPRASPGELGETWDSAPRARDTLKVPRPKTPSAGHRALCSSPPATSQEPSKPVLAHTNKVGLRGLTAEVLIELRGDPDLGAPGPEPGPSAVLPSV